jgi:hypothetical protein
MNDRKKERKHKRQEQTSLLQNWKYLM